VGVFVVFKSVVFVYFFNVQYNNTHDNNIGIFFKKVNTIRLKKIVYGIILLF